MTHSAPARVEQVFGPSATSNKSFPTAVLSQSNCTCIKVIFHFQNFFFFFATALCLLRLKWKLKAVSIHLFYHFNICDSMSLSQFLVHMQTHSTSNFMLHLLERLIHSLLGSFFSLRALCWLTKHLKLWRERNGENYFTIDLSCNTKVALFVYNLKAQIFPILLSS